MLKEKKDLNSIRGIVRQILPSVINLSFIVALIGAFVASIGMSQIYGRFSGQYLLFFMISFIITTTIIIIGFGIMYLLLDIRDAIEKQNNISEKLETSEETKTEE